MSKMKVTHIIASLGRGGKERQLFELLRGLREDIDLSLIVLSKDLSYPVMDLGIEVVTIDKKERKWLVIHRTLLAHIRRLEPDIIHYWDSLSALFALEAKLLCRAKCVDGSIRYAGKLGSKLPQRVLKRLRFRLADHIVANSEAGLRVEGLLESRKATVIHNGIDTTRFHKTSGNDFDQSALGESMIRIVMLAGFRPAKDHDSFLRVAKNLCAKYDNISFLLIGDGEERSRIESLVPLVLRDKILFLGNRDNVEQILLHSDIGVLLNNTNGHAEGLSNAIMEYMAAGLPVVATKAGGTPELIINSDTGYLVESFNVAQVIDRITSLIEDPALRTKLGEAGRQLILSEFSLETMLKKQHKLYDSLLS